MAKSFFSDLSSLKTAEFTQSSFISSSNDIGEAELRHRQRRQFIDDTVNQMVPFDEGNDSLLPNEQLVDCENHTKDSRHTAAFGIDAYRPLKSISKSSKSNEPQNGIVSNGSGPAMDEITTEAYMLNNSSLLQPASGHENIQLASMVASNDVDEAEFVGEFTPGRGRRDDIEMEPLLAGDNDEEPLSSSAFDNTAFVTGDGDKSSEGSRGKRDKMRKSVEKLKVQDEILSAEESESSFSIFLQVSLPFFIAGFGTVGAGLVLDRVQHHRVFTEVPQIFVLVPALLGLKGNLEMTLASRLSTLANLGRMDTTKEKLNQIVGNMALIQAQAAVVGFLAAVFAIILGWIPKGEFRLDHAFLLCASSMSTAALASLILGAIMVAVVMLSKSLHINPDNVATPIAASLGDLTTLSLLAAVGGLLINTIESHFWLAPLVVAMFVLLCPLWIWIGSQNEVTRKVLISGWSPVIFSMFISGAGGFILEYTVATYKGIAVFQPVINGIGGNLVAVQASRISTSLHRGSRLGVLPASSPADCFNPCSTFFGKGTHSKAARVLLALVIPGHLVFMYIIHFLRAGHTPITPLFAILYCGSAVIQVSLLLYVCVLMVNALWKRKIDPDNSAIPYLTALGDLLGTALLAIAFQILHAVGDPDANLGGQE